MASSASARLPLDKVLQCASPQYTSMGLQSQTKIQVLRTSGADHSLIWADPNGLDVDEFADAEFAELAPVA